MTSTDDERVDEVADVLRDDPLVLDEVSGNGALRRTPTDLARATAWRPQEYRCRVNVDTYQ